MDRRRFLLTSLAGAVVCPLGADAQTKGKVSRVGYLGASAGGSRARPLSSSVGTRRGASTDSTSSLPSSVGFTST
jgi:hypothetical protein